jgi:hypothetical protein
MSLGTGPDVKSVALSRNWKPLEATSGAAAFMALRII